MFQTKHNRLHVNDHKNNLQLLVLSKTKTSFELHRIDCEAPPPNDNGLAPSSRPLPPFEGSTPPHDIHILASFHGLVCLGIIQRKQALHYSEIILYNPVTIEYKRLSKSNLPMVCYNIEYSSSTYRLYYNSFEDDYKFLIITRYNSVFIYSLISDSWRRVDARYFYEDRSVFTYMFHDGCSTPGTFLNENLYFLIENSSGRLVSIIRFDTKTERFSMIETPHVHVLNDQTVLNYKAAIMVQRGYLHVCVKYDTETSGFERTCIKLWKLDEYENLKEVVNYQLKPHDYIIPYLRPFHLMKNGNWLMIHHVNKERCIYEVNLKEKHIKDKRGKDKGNIYDDYELYTSARVDNFHLRLVNDVGYIETFVSPDRHMK